MLRIRPARLCGRYRAIPSKSFAHRAMICAALSAGESLLSPVQQSEDILATAGALSQLGLAKTEFFGERLRVEGGLHFPKQEVFCNESGSTLRFLLPVSLLFGGADFSGRGRLMQRPLEPFEALAKEKGWTFSREDGGLSLRGFLQPGNYRISGNVSSQYVSGLLMALPLVGESTITLTTPLESMGYVDITLQVMRTFGVEIEHEAQKFFVPKARYRPLDYTIEGDYSAAAFFLVMGALYGDITVCGLKQDSVQGDRAIVDILEGCGCDISWDNGCFCVKSGQIAPGGEIDVSQIPDLLPILAVLACAAVGETRFVNAARLRYKESDRLKSTAALINGLGGEAVELDDALIVRGSGRLRGGKVDAFGDHRIAMAAATAALICQGEVCLCGEESVAKSAPDFWREYVALGGRIG